MKIRYALAALAALATQVMAETTITAPDSLENEPILSAKRLKGSLTAGYNSNYVGRGIVISHSVAEGDSSEFAALKLNYDIGKESRWSIDSTLAYTMVSSGHTLYGNPRFGDNVRVPYPSSPSGWAPGSMIPGTIAEASGTSNNIENEFAVITAAKYTREYWNIAFGHDFIHGGLLGVMAKCFRDQGASCVNEVFVTPEWTPAKWLSIGCTTRFSFQGITGWWFEPYVTAKAPIIGTPEDPKLVGVCTMGLSATADYFESGYFACQNGTQAFFIKLSTPWFVRKDVIITPSVSFNWLGKGALKANERSEYKAMSANVHNVPFRNFGVVAGVSCTYVF